MKKVIALSLMMAAVVATSPMMSKAQDLKQIRCTCYIEPGVTRSGHYTHEGVISGRKEDLGKVAALYAVAEDGSVGEFIGYFDFYDTGSGIDTDGDGRGDSIKKGRSVDVFRETMTDANKWIKTYGDYVYIQYIEAEG